MATWPTSLPTGPQYVGFMEQARPSVIRTGMDAGPDKVRRRYTARVVNFSMRLTISTTQLDDFDSFFKNTLQEGSLRFDWKHPRTCSSGEFRFTDVPNYVPVSAAKWQVVFGLELLP